MSELGLAALVVEFFGAAFSQSKLLAVLDWLGAAAWMTVVDFCCCLGMDWGYLLAILKAGNLGSCWGKLPVDPSHCHLHLVGFRVRVGSGQSQMQIP